MGIVHTTVATLADEVGAEVNRDEWNATHAVGGTALAPTTDSTTNLGTSALKYATLHVDDIAGADFSATLNMATNSIISSTFDVASNTISGSNSATDDVLVFNGTEFVSTTSTAGSFVKSDLSDGPWLIDGSEVSGGVSTLLSMGSNSIISGVINAASNTITNIGQSEVESGIISDQTTTTSVQATTDFVMMFDDSASALRKVTPQSLASAHTHTSDQITDYSGVHTSDDITDYSGTHVKADITDTPWLIDGSEVSGVVSTLLNMSSNSIITGVIDAASNTITNIGASEVEAGLITDQTTLTAPQLTTDTVLLFDGSSSSLRESTLSVLPFAAVTHTHTSDQITDYSGVHTSDDITDYSGQHVKADITDTPWLIDGSEVSGVVTTLLNLAGNTLQHNAGQTQIGDAGGITWHLPTGDTYDFQVTGTTLQFSISETQINFQGNIATNAVVGNFTIDADNNTTHL